MVGSFFTFCFLFQPTRLSEYSGQQSGLESTVGSSSRKTPVLEFLGLRRCGGSGDGLEAELMLGTHQGLGCDPSTGKKSCFLETGEEGTMCLKARKRKEKEQASSSSSSSPLCI